MEENNARCCQSEDSVTCTNISTYCADLCLPVKLEPYALIGEITTSCCGEPNLTVKQEAGRCRTCVIMINQSVCITIPVEYYTKVESGELTVECKRLSDLCTPLAADLCNEH